MIALVRYHLATYMKSSKFVMPLASYVIIMLMLCGGTIDSATSMFSVSLVASYLFMVWSAFVFSDCEELIAEQISILKAGKNKKFYLSKNIFIIMWGIVYSLLGVIIPSLWYIISKSFHLGSFKYFTVNNLLVSFFMHICVCILGAAVGFVWHPRIMSNRKIAGLGVFSYAFMGLIYGPLALDIQVVKYIRWIFPPVYDLVKKVTENPEKMVFPYILVPSLVCVGYAIILVVFNVIWLDKKGF